MNTAIMEGQDPRRYLPVGATIVGRVSEMTADAVKGYLWRAGRPVKSAMLYTVDGTQYVVTGHGDFAENTHGFIGDDAELMSRLHAKKHGRRDIADRDYDG